MLDFTPKVVQFKVANKSYQIRYPNIKELQDYNNKMKKEDVDNLELVVDFLVGLGGDKEVILNLTSGQLKVLIQELTEEKKK